MPNTTTLNENLRSPIDYTEYVRLATPGANWKAPLSSIGRARLLAPATYYVSATGSDSNPGTIGSPWLTLQHAMNVWASTLDNGGFATTVNVGPGSFAGFGVKPSLGGGVLQFIGAGPASTTVTGGPNDGVSNNGENISAYVAGNVAFDQATFVLPANAIVINASGFGSTITLGNALTGAGNYTITGTGAPTQQVLSAGAQGSTINVNGSGAITNVNTENFWLLNGGFVNDTAIWTLTGTNVFAVFMEIVLGVYERFSAAFSYTVASGTTTGQRFVLFDQSLVYLNGLPPDPNGVLFPGTVPGQIFGYGQYNNITDYIGSVAGLPTATVQGARAVVNNALAPSFGAIVAGGGAVQVPVYADGTNWRCG